VDDDDEAAAAADEAAAEAELSGAAELIFFDVVRDAREMVELFATVIVPELAVELAMEESAVALATDVMLLRTALLVTTGLRKVWMSVGRAVNQAGVEPAENSEAISLETAAELVRASWRREDGMAVSSTERTETRFTDDEGESANAPAARAEATRSLYCISLNVRMDVC